jgi:hypothetical protein
LLTMASLMTPSNSIPATESRAITTTGETSTRICHFEAAAIRMTTIDARSITYRILASVRAFHQAIREIESFSQMPGQTSFRIWETPLIADCVVGHGGLVFSNFRRSGWMHRRLLPNRSACSQLCGPSTWQSEKGR